MRQKQRRGVLWIKALIWHKLQLSVYKWSSDTGRDILFSCIENAWFWLFWVFAVLVRIYALFLACLLQCSGVPKFTNIRYGHRHLFFSQIERVEPKKWKRLLFHRVFAIRYHIEHARKSQPKKSPSTIMKICSDLQVWPTLVSRARPFSVIGVWAKWGETDSPLSETAAARGAHQN